MNAPDLVFVNIDTETVDPATGDAYIIDTFALTDDEIEMLDWCETTGHYPPDAVATIKRVAVRVSDLWAAYRRDVTGDDR